MDFRMKEIDRHADAIQRITAIEKNLLNKRISQIKIVVIV